MVASRSVAARGCRCTAWGLVVAGLLLSHSRSALAAHTLRFATQLHHCPHDSPCCRTATCGSAGCRCTTWGATRRARSSSAWTWRSTPMTRGWKLGEAARRAAGNVGCSTLPRGTWRAGSGARYCAEQAVELHELLLSVPAGRSPSGRSCARPRWWAPSRHAGSSWR